MNAETHNRFFSRVVRRFAFYRVEDGCKLVAQKHRNNGGRRFVCAEPVVVARCRNGKTEQILIIVHRFYHGAQEKQELSVFIRRFARSEKVYAGIRCHRPVVVLAGAVNARKGLFVQQAYKSVTGRYLLHNFHCQLVVVGCDIGRCVYRRKLVLSGSNLVMLGFRKHAELPQLLVEISHICGDARLYDAEIMVVKLLSLRRLCAEKRSSAENKVVTFFIHFLVNKEVFLFGTDGGADALYIGVSEKAENSQRLLVQCLHRAEQGSFLVERFAPVGAERRGNTKRFVLYKGV